MGLYLGLLALLLLLAVNLAMFISLGKQGDERRKAIVEKAGAGTFAVTVCYLLFCTVEGVCRSITSGLPMEGKNPFNLLTVLSVTFLCHLLYFKKKYGD
jgi:hypothetical protein